MSKQIKIEIKNRWTGSILFEYLSENNTIKKTVSEAIKSGADLCEAYLCEAYLCGAYLCEADLRGADLREADLCEADLREADLRGADLCGAYLRGAEPALPDGLQACRLLAVRDGEPAGYPQYCPTGPGANRTDRRT